jgi:hypothetical protein
MTDEHMIDLTPTPDQYRAQLRLIIHHHEQSKEGEEAAAWARKELQRVVGVEAWGRQR